MRLTVVVLVAALIGCRGPIKHYQDMAILDPPPRPIEHELTTPRANEVTPAVRRPVVDEPLPIVKVKPKDEAESIRIINDSLEDAFFPYDRAELSAEALAALRHDARLLNTILADFPHLTVTVAGHCDERGSAEYNLGLGDRRARRAAEVLKENGVPEVSLRIVSYGKELPQCSESNEGCWRRNRRAHLMVKPASEPTEDESPVVAEHL